MRLEEYVKEVQKHIRKGNRPNKLFGVPIRYTREGLVAFTPLTSLVLFYDLESEEFHLCGSILPVSTQTSMTERSLAMTTPVSTSNSASTVKDNS